MNKIKAAKITLKGVVQGVGFRPFIHRLALKHHLPGWALNSSEGIEIRVEGNENSLNNFIEDISIFAPPAANIIYKRVEYASPESPTESPKSFNIKKSKYDKKSSPIISPDIGICHKCKEELFSLNNRRYGYPFITCTECGPRFTVIFNTPYDRKVTTMNEFFMCSDCLSEYQNIKSRRYHSQSNSCTQCGPHLFLVDNNRKKVNGDPIFQTIQMLAAGKIVAIKGIGGFHLAVNASDSKAVARLRRKRERENKPFAIMVKNIETCLQHVEVSTSECNLLESPQSPIVILEKKETQTLAEEVAPYQKYLGIMLPYAPVHHLLLASSDNTGIGTIVMTSGNMSGEPIITDNEKAQNELSHIADYFLLNNRAIHNRCDDSILSVGGKKSLVLRRARGYAPFPIITELNLKRVLACGGELKNTFTLCNGNTLFMSQYIGDIKTAYNFDYYQEAINRFTDITGIEPEIVAYDLHPQMLNTQFATAYIEINNTKGSGIQHHHAHVASCMVDNNIIDGKVIGIALDGTGYGTDGNLWGSEFIIADYKEYKRYGHLKYMPMPGGEAAIKEPIRMGISLLYEVYGKDIFQIEIDMLKKISGNKLDTLVKMIEKGVNSPLTSSCGRFFDAVASLIGLREKVTFEAQAAIELEQIADNRVTEKYDYDIMTMGDVKVIDPSYIISGIVKDISDEAPLPSISAKFHNSIIDFSVDMCKSMRKETGLERVVLSGGVFQNRYLLSGLEEKLGNSGFTSLVHKNIPCNDGGISIGQAVIASMKHG